MDENQTPDTATETFQPEDVREEVSTPENATPAKPQFQIDLFQMARVHTEQFVQEFDDEAAARKFIEDLCEEKGVKADYEIKEIPVEPENDSTEEVASADENVSEDENANLSEGSDEKTTQENSLPLN